jgi:ribosome biogenesis GTPase A
VAQSGYFLAASGAVGRNAYDDEEVALELLATLKRRYPALLEARFRLSGVAAMADEDLLAEVGRQRGALQGRGRVNLQKAAEIVMHEFRSATLGRITLEMPDEFAAWVAEAEQREAERAAKKEARARERKGQRMAVTPRQPDPSN